MCRRDFINISVHECLLVVSKFPDLERGRLACCFPRPRGKPFLEAPFPFFGELGVRRVFQNRQPRGRRCLPARRVRGGEDVLTPRLHETALGGLN